MIEIGTDRYGVVPHGVAHTHLDSLAHIHYDGVFYNGYKPDADSVMKNRHTRNSIINLKNGIFTRGILIDLPRLKGVPYLEPGTPIYAQDIEAWEKIAGVKVSAGDALFIRTGRWARRAAVGPFDTNRTGKRSGPSASMIPWLRAARCRAAGRRRSTKPCSVGCRGGDRRGSRLRARLPRRSHLRQLSTSKRWPKPRSRANGGSFC